MSTFQLKDGSDLLELDHQGFVSMGGARIGTWSTNNGSQVVVAKTSGGESALDVDWLFDEDNHLSIEAGGEKKFDFHSDAGVRPLYRTVNSVLFVKPDRNGPFEFALRPRWALTPSHDLEMTVKGKRSVIDGFVFDDRSRFRYHFFNKGNLAEESILGFRGEWLNESGGENPGQVIFEYDLESPGAKDRFVLPVAVVVDRVLNLLSYTYDKAGQTFSVQLVGRFAFDNLELRYEIERARETDGKRTTLKFGAVITSAKAAGSLDFALVKKSGAVSSTILSITGNFTARFQGGVLNLGFRFQQERIGATLTNTFFFGGSIVHRAGVFKWEIRMSGKSMIIGISAQQIKLGDARIDPALNVTLENGKVVGLRALLGVSF
jgi:hypothetical protein